VSPVPRRKKAAWTDQENERLKALVAQGVSIIRAAATFKRTILSVRTQARKIGSPFPPMKEYRKKFADPPANLWRRY
jgi:serine/threonine-protein kinase RIO1